VKKGVKGGGGGGGGGGGSEVVGRCEGEAEAGRGEGRRVGLGEAVGFGAWV